VMMTDLPSRRPMRFSLCTLVYCSFKMKSLEAIRALTYSDHEQY
jgi:hypothetical protein